MEQGQWSQDNGQWNKDNGARTMDCHSQTIYITPRIPRTSRLSRTPRTSINGETTQSYTKKNRNQPQLNFHTNKS